MTCYLSVCGPLLHVMLVISSSQQPSKCHLLPLPAADIVMPWLPWMNKHTHRARVCFLPSGLCSYWNWITATTIEVTPPTSLVPNSDLSPSPSSCPYPCFLPLVSFHLSFKTLLGPHWWWSWNSDTLATSCKELTHWKRPWCWEGLGAGGEGDDRGWDGWMASPTQWAWVWVNSRSLWWIGRPGMLQFMGSQRVRHDWVTELNWTEDLTSPGISPEYPSPIKAELDTPSWCLHDPHVVLTPPYNSVFCPPPKWLWTIWYNFQNHFLFSEFLTLDMVSDT